MTRETMQWLNLNTLVGFTEKRGNAWHYKAELQGTEHNHYLGAIPVEDVRRRLFHWQAVEAPIQATYMDQDIVVSAPSDNGFKAIMRSDTGDILGVFKSGYQIHQYEEWLLNQVSAILDDELSIGSAGLLKNGGQAWVQVEVPENFRTASGVVFRPNLLAATSLDGSLATTFKRTITNVVCDNTMAIGLSEEGQKFKVRHTKYSNSRLIDIRQALELVHDTADEFSKQVEALTNIAVSEGDWNRFLDALVPVPADEGIGQTKAMNKQGLLNSMYFTDPMVAPWNGTAFGVVQAVNTWMHHKQGAKEGSARAQSNMSKAVTGQTEKLDMQTFKVLQSVLA